MSFEKTLTAVGLQYTPPSPSPQRMLKDRFSVLNSECSQADWHRKFVSPAIRHKEYDLCIDELAPRGHSNIFTGQLLTKDFCSQAIGLAEEAAAWTNDRHENYPTTDVLISDLGLNALYENNVLSEYIYPLAKQLWRLVGKEWDPQNRVSETFLVKYSPDTQAHLSLHHDSSDYTCVVVLNDEFEGGGTYFDRQQLLSNGGVGSFTLHPGNITHRHGARAVTAGVRYVLISFVNALPDIDSHPSSLLGVDIKEK